MTRGFVERGIDRDHEIDCFQCFIESPPIRRRQHRIAGTGKHEPDLSLARSGYLFNHGCRWQFIVELRQTAGATLKTIKATGATIHDLIHGRFGE